MNKNLEKEYISLMNDEASKIDADALWLKIENALPEKEVEAEKTNQKVSNNIVDIKSKTKWYKNRTVLSFAGTFAAACLILVIVLPGMNRRGYKDTAPSPLHSSSLKNDSAMEEAYYDAEATDIIESDFSNMENATAEAPDSIMEQNTATESTQKDSLAVCVTEFMVAGFEDGQYTCIAKSENRIFSEGNIFIITEGGYELEIDEVYTLELSIDDVNDSIIICSVIE